MAISFIPQLQQKNYKIRAGLNETLHDRTHTLGAHFSSNRREKLLFKKTSFSAPVKVSSRQRGTSNKTATLSKDVSMRLLETNSRLHSLLCSFLVFVRCTFATVLESILRHIFVGVKSTVATEKELR